MCIFSLSDSRNIHLTVSLLLAVSCAALSEKTLADDRNEVFGAWASAGSIIEITSSDNALSARVVALKDPLYREDETAGVPGTPRLDDQNPEPALRERSILGLELLSEYAFDGRRWEGKIYDPESGKVYSSNMRRDGDVLKMRGYIGVPLLGRTQIFQPVASCAPHIREMIEIAELNLSECD